MINTLLLLFLFQFGGEFVQRATDVPVPGPVIGMLGLLIFLLVRGSASENIMTHASQLLGHLPLFFIPAGAGLMLYPQVLAEHGLAILVSLIAGTALAFAFTAKFIQWLTDRRSRNAGNSPRDPHG